MLTLPYTSHKKAQPSCVWEGQAVMTSSAILFEAYPQDIICTNIHSFLMYRQEVMALPPAIHGIRHNGGGSWGSESLETNKWTPLSLTQEFCSGFNLVRVCVFSEGHSPSSLLDNASYSFAPKLKLLGPCCLRPRPHHLLVQRSSTLLCISVLKSA